MTAIAAVVHRGRVWMAGDSCSSAEGLRMYPVTPKVRRIGEFVVGVAGGGPVGEVAGAVDWARRDWGAQIRARASELGADDFELIWGWRGEIWHYDAGSVYQAGNFSAAGDAATCILCALEVTRGMPPAERVREAVRAAGLYHPSVGGPVCVEVTPRPSPKKD